MHTNGCGQGSEDVRCKALANAACRVGLAASIAGSESLHGSRANSFGGLQVARPWRHWLRHDERGVVFSLFITMPYGKFVHGIYRFVALVRYARERRMTGHV
jgi:hypothetical protein